MGDETAMFPILSSFAFNILSLRHSSANVEKIFSAINLMKTKERNKLNTESITGLLHAKKFIGNSNCYTFPVEKQLL